MSKDIGNRLKELKKSGQSDPVPQFFDLSKKEDQKKVEIVLDNDPHIKVIDTYETQLKELFVLDNPPLHMNPPLRDKEFAKHRDKHYGKGEAYRSGKWVYLPWRNVLLHILDDDGYQQVRTGRNRNLITKEEQKKFYNSTIAIAGLSVGNSCALAIVLTGGGKHMRLADPDVLELTNLNRIRGSVSDLTSYKVYMTARQIYELDPYANLKLFADGLTEDNMQHFFNGVDVMVDEIDQLGMKIRLRQEAKKRKVPVVMATDNGDSGLLDVERHDLEDDIPVFHGRAGEDIADRVLGKDLPLPVVGKIIGEELVGFNITEPRMQRSLLEIGRSIPTWPQLGGAALLNGVAVALAVRKILTGQPLVKDRAILSLSSWLVPGYAGKSQIEKRKKETQKFARQYDAAVDAFLERFGEKQH